MEDSRRSIRTPLIIEVHVMRNPSTTIVGTALNVSEGGVMVKAAALNALDVGEDVTLQTWNGEVFGPVIPARLVWRKDDVTGFEFKDEDPDVSPA